MARVVWYFGKKQNRNLMILTATSGDTGSAVAQSFYGLDNIKAVVLFPKDKVSARQRKQMTTLGKNMTTIAVDGKFDDCQKRAKEAFLGPALKSMNLSSANSINIGRLIPRPFIISVHIQGLPPMKKNCFSQCCQGISAI